MLRTCLIPSFIKEYRSSGIHMLYCFKLARLDFLGWIPLKLEYLPCRHAITKVSELTGYHSPTIKDENLLSYMFQ